ncbi:bifunctional hydroxymethylpyrimidine kinase/phosphomethylpyrimidine kinase [Aquibacillus halophilus]|uniref:pyridoxal kinase n=1 Tax=Aquibacillus halophilus TaxID=930132 RepID=A0A6A8DGS6_9BACI|nr:bifunctional hydroxymethylpyrimidine kinase/phosphomethylpyrimidine kinase [Aquibacillus halophilus]MRH43716.1 bifunctional hydroxymethylpyrimidine kinase/phosphomethylpyrimidine kinase [Aquibacillus halophilus]
MSIKRVLSIAGSAAQGSAGIQADLKTFQERDVYGMAAITAIVANNSITEKGVFIHSSQEIEAQYYAAIEHVGVDAIKTGMLFSEEIIELVSDLLRNAPTKNIVVDPVMIGKMGSQLLKDDAIEVMKEKLFPIATVITPNLHEAARILNQESLISIAEMKRAAQELYELGPKYVLIKGGATLNATDVLYDGKSCLELHADLVDTIHTSGAGCSYSAAITAELAKGKSIHESVEIGKKFVTMAIKYSLSFDRGIGSTYHAALGKFGGERQKK